MLEKVNSGEGSPSKAIQHGLFLYDDFQWLNQPTHGGCWGHERLSVRIYQAERDRMQAELQWQDNHLASPEVGDQDLPVFITIISWFGCFCLFNLTHGTVSLPKTLNSTNIWEEMFSSKMHRLFPHRDTFFLHGPVIIADSASENCGQRYFPCPGFRCSLWPSNFLDIVANASAMPLPQNELTCPFPNLCLPGDYALQQQEFRLGSLHLWLQTESVLVGLKSLPSAFPYILSFHPYLLTRKKVSECFILGVWGLKWLRNSLKVGDCQS